MKSLSWINFILGLWLIVAPFVLLFYREDTVATWDNVIVGIIVAILTIIRALESGTMPMQQQHGSH